MGEYVFTWAGWQGQKVRKFDDACELLAYMAGWFKDGGSILSVSITEFRA